MTLRSIEAAQSQRRARRVGVVGCERQIERLLVVGGGRAEVLGRRLDDRHTAKRLGRHAVLEAGCEVGGRRAKVGVAGLLRLLELGSGQVVLVQPARACEVTGCKLQVERLQVERLKV